MNAKERGFLLLTSHLGDPERKVLSPAQLRILARRMQTMGAPTDDRDLTERDLVALGYSREMSQRITMLLSQEELLNHYLMRGEKAGCTPITRVSRGYPQLLRRRLGVESPGVLWAKGDLSILDSPAISLVGSRDLKEPNREFAAEVGRHAASSGMTLVSGNARGADRTAQRSCLRSGGRVISIIADDLSGKPEIPELLFLSEEDYDMPFSAQRALSRNRCIHALGGLVFVAQSDYKKGGTWDGTAKNLHFGWSPVVCFDDGSEAVGELEQMGAYRIGLGEIKDFRARPEQLRFL